MAKLIIDKLFDKNKKFQREDFLEFVSEITGKYPSNTKKSQDKDGLYLRELITIYEDKSGEKISIMIYKMPSSTKVEKARSYQRNLISSYLKNEGVFEGIDSVLCAFYSEDTSDWRLSFVKQEFKLNPETKKILNELTPAKRYSFLVESNSKNVTVKQRLNSLLESSNILVSDIEKTFSVEKVSKEFFDKYVKLYEKLVEAFKDDKVFLKIISESNNGDENFRENFVKKLLGQIVFLYFLQKKGWLGVPKDGKWGEGNKNFLQDLLKECLSGGDESKELGGKNFFNDYLEHLFYANLNQKRENDYSEYFKCRIPYLNGGLFEPINNYHWKGFEYVVLSGDKNNSLFKEIFDTFDEYNFTVYENDPLEQDVAVDPEMLGKVFENLLPENERKGKGAFYTPREIVHYMCKESLKNHIINKTGITEDKINGLFERKDSMYNSKKFGKELSSDERYTQFGEFIEYAENIVSALKTVKIVDPAVGSGAFPMGLLKEIVSLRKYLQENILLEDKVSEYQIKKETLENCIYGVDLDPGAVEIAKLRFWLSLVIEEESGDNIDPLPNLDYKIMQGNSLIEDIVVGDSVIKIDLENSTKKLTKKEEKEFGSISQGTMSLFADEVARDDILKRLKYLHKIFFQEKDNNKKKSLKTEIDHIEKELIRISGEVEVNRIKSQIDNIEGKYIISGMAWDEKDAKKVAEFYSQISSIKEMEEKYKRDNIRSFFPWKLHFGEVFNENGGFDIVIGNPPYIDSEEMVKSQLKEREIIGKNYESAKGNWDIFIPFIEKGTLLLSNNGFVTYIVPNKLIGAKYSETLKCILSSYKIHQIRDYSNVDVFKEADVYPVTFLIEKNTKDKKDVLVSVMKNKSEIEISNIVSKELFYLDIFWDKFFIKNKILLGLIIKLGHYQNTLDNKYIVSSATVGEAYKIKEVIKEFEATDENYFKFINTGTIDPYLSLWESAKTTYIKGNYKKPIVFKGDIDFINNTRFIQSKTPKLIIAGMACKFEVFYDKVGEFMGGKSTTLILKNDKTNIGFICSILNSKLLSFWYVNYFRSLKMAGGYLNFNPNTLSVVPIKQISPEEQKPFIDLVDQILEITKKEDYLEREDLRKQVKVLEAKIDEMVYKLYELTPEEIELVEESLK
ncbi:MAG: Eco57I restriction-modification methylase domain-containing protein [Candidatus Gracilibacteria bacterium]|nr:Eco57I restriction-modification methylase domain-containing protein [Candidatus Gracilibacteria bacterium]